MDFALPRQRESALPLLADAQSAAVGSNQSRLQTYLERGITHPSREGQENLANAK